MKKFFAPLLAGLLLLSCTSCALRETYEKVDPGESYGTEGTPSLTIAEKVNDLDSPAEDPVIDVPPNEPDAKTEFRIVITGDIKLDEAMIEDARAHASEGKDYAFLRMYTGVYRTINDADFAVGAYSAIGKPYGTEAEYEPPTEHLDALASLGYDLLDISGMGSDYRVMEEHGLSGFSDAEQGDEAFKSVEKDGVTYVFSAVGADGSAQSYNDDGYYASLRSADEEADFTLVSVHWDEEIEPEEAAEIAEKLAEAGADAVVGYGESLGRALYVETTDGRQVPVIYSVGNLLSTSDEGYCLVSGILSLTFTTSGEETVMTAAVIPTVVHYTAENAEYCVYRLIDYTDDLAQANADEVDVEGLTEFALGKIPAEFLPAEFLPDENN